MNEGIDKLTTSIEVLNTKVSLLHEMNEIKYKELHADILNLSMNINDTLKDHDVRIRTHSILLGFGKGIIATLVFIIGGIGMKLMSLM